MHTICIPISSGSHNAQLCFASSMSSPFLIQTKLVIYNLNLATWQYELTIYFTTRPEFGALPGRGSQF